MSDDRGSGAEWPIRRRKDRIDTSPQPGADNGPAEDVGRSETRVETRRAGINPIFLALGGLVLLLVVGFLVFGRGNSDQDKLTNGASSNSAAADDPEKLCASKQTYDMMKRELFRRAAQVRGSDQEAFDRLSAYAVIRMQNPVMESEDQASHRVNCSGSLSLDLPPGVAVVGGRTTLTSDIDYTLQPAADGTGNVILLRNADAIISPLATLARTAQTSAPAGQADITSDSDEAGAPPEATDAPAPPTAPSPVERPAPPAAPPQPDSGAHPSFNCANARTGGEKAVCADPGLASLDRRMASEFNSAMSDADAGQRALLQRTRSRFLSYRDHCGSDACIAESYRGRIREIRDIMAGRWQGQ